MSACVRERESVSVECVSACMMTGLQCAQCLLHAIMCMRMCVRVPLYLCQCMRV